MKTKNWPSKRFDFHSVLVKVLESSVSLEKREVGACTEQEDKSSNGNYLWLLKDVKICNSKLDDNERTSSKLTFCTLFQRRLQKKIFSGESELTKICRDLAISDEWLLSNKSTFWVHPKNLRYCENYVIENVLPKQRLLLKPSDKTDLDWKNCEKGSITDESVMKISSVQTRKQKRKRKLKKMKTVFQDSKIPP